MPTTRRSIASLAVATAAAMALASAPASAGDGSFGRGEDVAAEHPTSVAVGDFNSDGRPDLVAANYTAAYVHLRLGAPGGGFVPGPNVSVLTGPVTVVVADFNADGHDDLAVNRQLYGKVTVRLGVGDGTFFTAQDVELPRAPTSLAVGDFNGDNKVDLAIPNSDSGGAEVAVRLGVGDGTFIDGGKADVEARAATVGDFNSDGIEDLVGGSRDSDAPGRVLIGTGGGRLTAGGPIALPGFAIDGRAWAVGDFNRDGNQDVAAAIRSKDVVSVRFGAGDGTFASGPDLPTGDAPSAVAVGDFDADGNEDLAVTNASGLAVSVRLGDGAGGFTVAADVPVGLTPIDVALADFDRDGNDDLVVANGLGDSLSVRPGLGAPPLAGNLLVNGGFEGPGAAALHTRSPAIPGWQRSGGMTYIRYGIPAHDFFPPRLAAPRWNGGGGLLWGGSSVASNGITEASQTVDVSAATVSIDAGRATVNLSADLGGALDVPDVMTARAEFLSAGGGTLGSLVIGPVTVADRRRQTTLVRRAASAPVPIGTRRMRVTLTSTDADKTYSSATADNVKLTLDTPGRPGGQPSADRRAPVIGRFTLAPRRFAVGPRAATIRYRLSEPATVTLRIQRLRGRRPVGTLRRAGRAGANRVAFSGRIGRRALRRGTYRLTATATDPAGNRSRPRTTRFRVVR
jgi:VCBS repeat protein/FG-GAP repeat protein